MHSGQYSPLFFAISSFVLIEAPLPVIIIISTTSSCIKYSKSKMHSKNNESLTRKMLLLPFLTTLISIIPFTIYKYFVIALRELLPCEERKQSPAIGTHIFGSMVFEFFAGLDSQEGHYLREPSARTYHHL